MLREFGSGRSRDSQAKAPKVKMLPNKAKAITAKTAFLAKARLSSFDAPEVKPSNLFFQNLFLEPQEC